MCLAKILVTMATNSSRGLILGKMVSPGFLCHFDRIFFRLAGYNNRHKNSDWFEIQTESIFGKSKGVSSFFTELFPFENFTVEIVSAQ